MAPLATTLTLLALAAAVAGAAGGRMGARVSLLAAGASRPEGQARYLSFGIMGDLTNIWEAVVNSAMVAATLKTNLVVPPVYRTQNGKFSDVWDLTAFQAGMRKLGVEVVEAVPDGHLNVSLAADNRRGVAGLVASISPEAQKYVGRPQPTELQLGAGDVSYDLYVPRRLIKCKKELELCGPVTSALQFRQELRDMSSRVVRELNGRGEWLAVHVHDFTAFLCHGDLSQEFSKIRERLQRDGSAPGNIYVVGGTDRIEELQKSLDTLKIPGLKVLNKKSILGDEVDKLGFQESAAVDFGVALEAGSYFTKPGSSFDELLHDLREIQGKQVHTVKLPQTWQGCESEEKAELEKAQEKASSFLR